MSAIAANDAKIAVVGAGLIGRSWAIVFARAGHKVALFDADVHAVEHGRAAILPALEGLEQAGLLDETPARVLERVTTASTLAQALDGAVYVQENIAENLAAKQALFAQMDRVATPSTVLASSTSGILASRWSAALDGRSRCLVAHPVNPPHLVPLVELAPAPWTAPDVVELAKALHEGAGQVPIVVRKETQGFIVNRLQGALLAEAFRLYADGYVSVDDLDKTVRDGLGLRWSFMGPFETIDLNAPGGIADYCARYGPLYFAMDEERTPLRWDEMLVRGIEAERRALLDERELAPRSRWRDRRLMDLVAHKRRAAT